MPHQFPRRALALLPVLLLAACAQAPAENLPTVAPQATAQTPAEEPLASFADWRRALRSEAIAAGIDAALFDRVFAGVTPDPAVLKADSSQPEFTRPVWEYLDGAVSSSRIGRGRVLLAQHNAVLQRIERQYGVEAPILVAIWGLESNFGSNIGSHSVIRSLATLAYDGRRQGFWRVQLLAALQILQNGDVPSERMIGSWAGAMGQTQFMPTTYNQHAVDFDGDGKRDLWGSSTDALASAAHYLQASGWQRGQPWGFEVRLPSGFDYSLADPDQRRTLAEWAELGVRPLAPTGAAASARASLQLPAGHKGPAFLLLDNFRSILKYNNSTSYALAIGLLADNLLRPSEIQGQWPRGERQLGRSERVELQERLAQAGFDPGPADGIIGANTRKAIRALQLQLNWPADGYPNTELLQQLRAR
ncbi:lytic murein transglycosylase [Ectopseudomonas guguanensis]|jgi:membrane-bound lytic murein transglycosylase B|uniref:Membrane-bound lytic murein transglycosylase B n=1 Tax=Ectopseudomonas guguanensis TaxID=1198456 RepID=A0A1H0XCK9_9GAMM|nr:MULTISPECIES: lytic murein transglycosylase [Pseudomonas]MDR8017820.1 lytic murein transglycosylase [Pseudomonas guguanensis]MPT19918.1 lytic murein transglycosylase [Pseudomonas sp.]WJH58752.1 lytic murein transglycosylase [Pseudomonas guguanensis]SDQ00658.1 membrane-bound lytic murein transglycosylase B [Pseudomonas guguanensis]